MRASIIVVILLLIMFDLVDYYHAYQDQLKMKSYYDQIQQQQLKEQKHHSADFFFPRLLKLAQASHCQILKIHPWFADPIHLHFDLRLHGQYEQLLAWILAVHQGLPMLVWEKISFHRVSFNFLELLVHCYEAD